MACCGGVGAIHEPTQEAHEIVAKIKSEVEQKTGKTFHDDFKAVQHRTQLVNGINHFLKVDIGNGHYLHLRVHKAFPHAGEGLTLSAVQENKKLEDSLDFFG